MSRQFPIYISESEEEPEYASDEVVSETKHSPVGHRATSDGTIDTSPPSPPTDPNNRMLGSTFMNARHLVGESSRGPGMCRTARMSVRAPHVGPLAPRDKEPMTKDREIPCDQPSQQGVRVPHLDWMPRILHHWRTLERIPSTFETGESSHSSTPFHLTREPLELTIPTVVAVIRTLLGFHYGTQDSIRELHSDASRLEGDVLTIYGRIATSEVHIEMDREYVVTTRARLIMLERRASAVGAAVGLCVLMAAIRMVVGWCLPYFY